MQRSCKNLKIVVNLQGELQIHIHNSFLLKTNPRLYQALVKKRKGISHNAHLMSHLEYTRRTI